MVGTPTIMCFAVERGTFPAKRKNVDWVVIFQLWITKYLWRFHLFDNMPPLLCSG